MIANTQSFVENPQYDIRAISAAETRPLRHQLLRPHHPPEKLVYPGDDDPESLHVGAFLEHRLVGIASISRQPFPFRAEPGSWQLRGMAIIPDLRRQGYGAALIRACLDHAAARGGAMLWCNGRSTAAPFYQALGFQIEGEEFMAETGPHYVLWRYL